MTYVHCSLYCRYIGTELFPGDVTIKLSLIQATPLFQPKMNSWRIVNCKFVNCFWPNFQGFISTKLELTWMSQLIWLQRGKILKSGGATTWLTHFLPPGIVYFCFRAFIYTSKIPSPFSPSGAAPGLLSSPGNGHSLIAALIKSPWWKMLSLFL